MQKWAWMLMKTGKAFVNPSAVRKQKEDSNFWSLPPLIILCWRTLLVITKYSEDGPGIAQMETPQPNWLHSSEDMLLIRSEHCQNMKLSRSSHWKWPWLADHDPPSPEKKQRAKTHKTQVLPQKAERSQCVPSYDRQEVCTLTIMNNEDADTDLLIVISF